MNFNHLAVFHAVARAGSVSGGAAELMIGQPAASRQLKQLERAVGEPLFTRTPTGVCPTEAGEVLADYARRIFGLADEAAAAVADLRGLDRGRLRVGATPTLGTHLLPDVLVRLRRRFPHVRVHAEIGPRDVLAERLLAGEVDVGLSDHADPPGGIEATPFMADRYVAVAPAGHRSAGVASTLSAFLGDPLVLRASGRGGPGFVERALRSRGIAFRPAMSLASTEAVKRAVSAGLGVAIVPRLSIDLELAAGHLRVVPLSDLDLSRPCVLLRRAGEPATKPQRAFHCLLEHVARDRAP